MTKKIIKLGNRENLDLADKLIDEVLNNKSLKGIRLKIALRGKFIQFLAHFKELPEVELLKQGKNETRTK